MDSRFLSSQRTSAIHMEKVIAVFYDAEAEIDSRKIILIADSAEG